MAHAAPTLRPEYLTPDEFAGLVGCSRAHVFNLIRRGELPSLKLGRIRRIPLSAVDALVTGGAS